jgi:hypothetical protein
MFCQTDAPFEFRLSGDWQCQPGEIVEVRRAGVVARRGLVEAVMPDGSGFWLAANGIDQRLYFHKEIGLELWVRH